MDYSMKTLKSRIYQILNGRHSTLELDSALQNLNRDFTTHNPNILGNEITHTYINLIDKYMPLKKLSIYRKRNPDKPWITKGLKKSLSCMKELEG